MKHVRSFDRARGLAVAGLLILTGASLPPGASAQAVEPPPTPGRSGTGLFEALAEDVYPRAETEVEVRRGNEVLKIRSLRTTRFGGGREALADRVIVAFQEGTSDADRADAHTRAASRGAMAARPVAKLGPTTQLVDVSGAPTLQAAARAYRTDPRVRYVGPDLVMRKQETPNDTLVSAQWGLTKIKAPDTWNRTHGSSARRIAILDTGIDETHPDMAGRVVARRDFTGSPVGTADVDGHGTHVAGIAGAATNNLAGVAGVAYNTRLLAVKVLADDGFGSISMISSGIRWAVDNGAEVINMSLGGSEDCEPSWWEDLFDVGIVEVRDAINYAYSKNAVLVAAAGNGGTDNEGAGEDTPIWPAHCPNVLSVANTMSNDIRSGTSNFGKWVDVAAPGDQILSSGVPGATGLCMPPGTSRFAVCSGTSMAAPHVAGLAALIRTTCDYTSPQLIVDRITRYADPIAGTGTEWQYGRINALRATCYPAPSNLRLGTVTASSIQVVWNDTIPFESSFELNHRPRGTINWTNVRLPAGSTSWTHTGLPSGVGYDYRVRACDANGCGYFSNYVTGFTGSGAGYTLTVSVSGGGTVTSTPAGISCASTSYTDCTEPYAPGTTVTLRANSISSSTGTWLFDHWEGSCSGTYPGCTVVMSANRSVSAVFKYYAGYIP